MHQARTLPPPVSAPAAPAPPVICVDIAGASAALSISPATIKRAVASGELRSVKFGTACRFLVDDLRAFAESRATKGDHQPAAVGTPPA